MSVPDASAAPAAAPPDPLAPPAPPPAPPATAPAAPPRRAPLPMSGHPGLARTRRELALTLRPNWRRWAEAYVALGCGKTKTKAALEVGYSETHAAHAGTKIAKDPDVQEYIAFLLADQKVAEDSGPSFCRAMLREIADDKTVGAALRIQAVKLLLGKDDGGKKDDGAGQVVIHTKIFVGVKPDDV